MSLGLLGNKIGMTQIFNIKGEVVPITIIKCGPCFITQILLKEKCGYNAIQLGYIEVSNSNKLTNPEKGHFIKNNLPLYYYLKEYKTPRNINLKLGQKITLDLFKIGEKINIKGLSIGKGYSGNIKKNNFSRGPMSHGSKHHRLQGSLGAGTDPGRVFPGKKMSGRLGQKNCTILSLEILDMDTQKDLIFIKGSIPGKKGNLINLIHQN